MDWVRGSCGVGSVLSSSIVTRRGTKCKSGVVVKGQIPGLPESHCLVIEQDASPSNVQMLGSYLDLYSGFDYPVIQVAYIRSFKCILLSTFLSLFSSHCPSDCFPPFSEFNFPTIFLRLDILKYGQSRGERWALRSRLLRER